MKPCGEDAFMLSMTMMRTRCSLLSSRFSWDLDGGFCLSRRLYR